MGDLVHPNIIHWPCHCYRALSRRNWILEAVGNVRIYDAFDFISDLLYGTNRVTSLDFNIFTSPHDDLAFPGAACLETDELIGRKSAMSDCNPSCNRWLLPLGSFLLAFDFLNMTRGEVIDALGFQWTGLFSLHSIAGLVFQIVWGALLLCLIALSVVKRENAWASVGVFCYLEALTFTYEYHSILFSLSWASWVLLWPLWDALEPENRFIKPVNGLNQ